MTNMACGRFDYNQHVPDFLDWVLQKCYACSGNFMGTGATTCPRCLGPSTFM